MNSISHVSKEENNIAEEKSNTTVETGDGEDESIFNNKNKISFVLLL